MDVLEKKEKLTLKELKQWFDNPNRTKNNYDEPISKINDFIDYKEGGVSCKAVSLQFVYLDTWYNNSFAYNSLIKKDGAESILMSANQNYILSIYNLLAKAFPNRPPYLLFDNAGFYLANCLIRGWYGKGKESLGIINEGFDNGLLRGGLDFRKTAWFVIELANLAYGIDSLCNTFDNYPDDMAYFNDVLDQWNSKDLGLVDRLVTRMCDNHLLQANFESDNTFYEYNTAATFLYVYEVLAWLSLRRYVGLENPKEFSHPMMKYTINQLPSKEILFQESDLYKKVEDRIKKELDL